MDALTADNRVLRSIEATRRAIASGEKQDGSGPIDPASLAPLEASLAVTFEEHFAYQNAQARAHALGRITTAEAQTVYVALGEVGSDENGGWAAGTDLATKVVVTNLMLQLVGLR